MPNVQPSTVASARGERSSAAKPVEQLRDPRVRAASESAPATASSADQRRRARRPARAASRRSSRRRRRARRASSDARAAERGVDAAGRPEPARPSIAREQSAILTASPSFAGANELTSEPMPSRAAACRGQIRPPAPRSAARQAPTVQRTPPTKPSAASASQVRSAPPSASSAGRTRPPSRRAVAAAAASASEGAERRAASCGASDAS